MLQTYFDDLGAAWEPVTALPVAGVGLDFVRGRENLDHLERRGFPADKALGIGLVDGRNVWRTDLEAALCHPRADRAPRRPRPRSPGAERQPPPPAGHRRPGAQPRRRR